MLKRVKVDGYTYIMEKAGEKWEITHIIYPSVTGWLKIEVPEEARSMLRTVKNADGDRLKRERSNRKEIVDGKGCTDYSECDQCGECSRSYKTVKRIRTDNPVLSILERQEHRAENKHAIDRAISQLPPKQRPLIRQRYIHDIKAAEISRLTGKSKSSISHMEKRALERLKNILS